MRILLTLIAAVVLAGSNYALAQQVDPNIRGPLRRGAGAVGDTLGAPGAENRIERREARRGDLRTNPDAWRMRYYNDEWWYYSPQSSWSYYRGNRWVPYVQNAYRPLAPRYGTGYRGVYTSRTEPYGAYDRFAYGAPGAPMLTVAIHDNSFEPNSIHIAPGTTVAWVNRDTHNHTVTSQDGTWDSGEIGPDGTYTARFKKPGTYHYLCDLHEGMQGTIVVGEGAASTAPSTNAVEGQRGANVDVNRNPLPGTEPPVQPQPQVTPQPQPQAAPQPQPAPQP